MEKKSKRQWIAAKVLADTGEEKVFPHELLIFEYHGTHPPAGGPLEEGFLGIWPEPPFYYLFFSAEPGGGLASWLAVQQGWALRDRYRLNYEQWQQLGEQRLQVGPLLIEIQAGVPVLPPTRERKQGLSIRIDPGLVFGSGLHGSTRGCLLALSELLADQSIRSVLDMGTGTGILAIACAALGVFRVVAVDNNPLAIRVAKKNVVINGFESRVSLLLAEDLRAIGGPVDLLVMNLEAAILQRLLDAVEGLGCQWLVLGGFLESQWEQVRQRIPAQFREAWRKTVDGWPAVVLGTAPQK